MLHGAWPSCLEVGCEVKRRDVERKEFFCSTFVQDGAESKKKVAVTDLVLLGER